MDGLGRAVGAGTTITAGGKTYKLDGLKLTDIGTIEQYLLSKRPSPFEMLREEKAHLDPDDYNRLLDKAFEAKLNRERNKIPFKEMVEWMDSCEGLIYTIWFGLHKNHPEVDMAKAAEIVNQIGDEQMKKVRDIAAGLDQMGNSTGPTQTSEPGQNASQSSPDHPSTSLGVASSAS